MDVSGAVFADRCPAHRAENVWNAHRPSEISRLTARRTTGDDRRAAVRGWSAVVTTALGQLSLSGAAGEACADGDVHVAPASDETRWCLLLIRGLEQLGK